MAEEVPITGGPEQAKIRSVFAPALLWIPTLGIYTLVWWYKINREMADLGRKRGTTELGDNPTLSLLALFPGGIIVVPAIWTIVTTYQRNKKAQQLVGVAPFDQLNGWIYALAMLILSPIAYAYLQSGLNKVWEIDSGRVPAGGQPGTTWAPAPAGEAVPPAAAPDPSNVPATAPPDTPPADAGPNGDVGGGSN